MERFRARVAVHLLLLRGQQVLLSLRANTGYEDGNYSVVAGHLDGGEDVLRAAIREAEEEAGIIIDAGDLTVVGVMHRFEPTNPPLLRESVDFFLTASRWRGEPTNCEPDRCAALAWFDRDHLPLNMVPYVRRGLENYKAGPWFESVGWDAAGGTPLR